MTIDVLNSFSGDTNRNSVASNLPASLPPAPPMPPVRSSVRRSLFGEVDHEESMEFLKKELDEISKSQMERWNFDFLNEKPLHDKDSNYEWTAVQPEEVVPKPYALSRLPYLCKNAEITTCTDREFSDGGCPDPPVPAVCQDVNMMSDAVEARLCSQVTRSKKLTQTSIHDFMKAKKRPATCLSFMKNESLCSSDNDVKDEGDGDGVVSSNCPSCKFLDNGESRECHNMTRHHHRLLQQQTDSKKLRLSPR